MKSRQVTALLLSAIMTVSACMPMNGISAFAAENTGAGSTETAAVVEPEIEEEAEEPEEQPAQTQEETVEEQAGESAAEEESTEPEADSQTEGEAEGSSVEEDSAEPEAEQTEEPSLEEDISEPEKDQAEQSAEPEEEADKPAADSQAEEETEETMEAAPEAEPVQKSEKGSDGAGTGSSVSTLTAYAEGYEGTTSVSMSVPAGESTNLKIIWETSSGETPTFQWCGDAEEAIEGATSDTFTTDPAILGETLYYNCKVSDSNENVVSISFEICGTFVDNHENVSFDTAEVINVGDAKEVTVSADKPYAYYKFIPETTGIYKFYSESGYDTFAGLYNSEEQEMATDDDDGDGFNFCVEYELTAGEAYYFRASFLNDISEDSFTVHLKENTLKVEGDYEETVYVNAGDEVTLNVIAQSKNDIAYTWYVDSSEVDCNGDSYTLTPDKQCTVSCVVNDGTGEVYRYFYIRIQNHLTVLPEGAEGDSNGVSLYASPNGAVTLKVNATADDTTQLTYSWYEYAEDKIIEGAEGDTYVTEPLTTGKDYYCRVEDRYGNSAYVYFYVSIENHLEATVEGSSSNYLKIEATPNEEVILKVSATADDDKNLTYTWYESGQQIEGQDTNTYVIEAVTTSENYYCRVEDPYGNTATVNFDIYIQNHLEAEIVDGSNENVTSLSLSVEPGEECVFKVNATADYTEQLTYTWYYDNEEIDGADSDTYNPGAGIQKGCYECEVRDQYDNSASVCFYIKVRNNLSVAPDGAEPGEDHVILYINTSPNEEVTLKVNVAATDTDQLTYEWYENDFSLIEQAMTDTFVVDSNGADNYTCKVIDRYGNCGYAYFTIEGSKLTVWPESAESDSQYVNLYASPNEEVTLKTNAVVDDGGPLTYSWYDNDGNRIGGANGNTYVTSAGTSPSSYTCRVEDQHGNVECAVFYIKIGHLTVTAEGAQDDSGYVSLNVRPNDEVTLNVQATSDVGSTFTYSWYGRGYQKIEGATSASYEVGPVTEYDYYYCVVKDQYENEGRVRFTIRVNHLTASQKGLDVDEDGIAYCYTPLNGAATLEVSASADDPSQLTYKWYKTDDYWEEIEGANEAAYTVDSVTKRASYSCRVVDHYGNAKHLDFIVGVQNNLVMTPDGAAGNSDRVTLYSGSNQEVTLKVNASADDTSQLKYSWYDSDDYKIYNANTSSLVVKTGFRDEHYSCEVKDQYGNFKEVYFDIIIGENKFQDLSEVTLDQESFVYDGNEHKPSVKVVYEGTELVSGTDYTIAFSEDVINAGTKNVTITGLGQYAGTIVKTYKITKASQTLSADDLSVEVGQSGKITVSGARGDVTFESSDESVATVSTDGTVTGVKTGTATITVTAAGNDNYSAGSTEVNVTVTGIDISAAGTITLVESEFTYDGEEHRPEVKVELEGTELVSGTDYETAFSDDVTTAGVKTVTVTGIGNYTGKLEKTYEIRKAAQTISADDVSVEFGGTGRIEMSGAQGDVTFESSDEAVATVSADGTVTGMKAGTATITVAAAGNENYNAGSTEVGVTVTAIDISTTAAVALSETEFTYNGEEQKPDVRVEYEGNELVSGTDYDVTFPDDSTNAGEKNVTINCKGNYSGELVKTYEIRKADQMIGASDLTLTIGESAKIELTGAQGDVTYASADDTVATVSEDGTVTGKEIGETKIAVTAAGNDNYNAGSAEVAVKVIESKYDFTEAEVTFTPAEFIYNGEEQKPEVIVVYNGEELNADTDYKITFSDDVINAGTKTVIITGNGEYAGEIEKTYEIAKASQTLSANDLSVEFGKSGKIEVSGTQNSVTFASADETIATVSADGTVTGVKAGDVTITVTAAGDDNHNETSAQINVTVTAINISNSAVAALGRTAFTYNAKVQRPTVNVTYAGTVLTNGTDYSVTYPGDCTNAGTKNVTISFKGNYAGAVVRAYTITKAAQPMSASLSAAKIVVGATSKVNISGVRESAKLTYVSSNTGVATVSAAGVVTAKKVGTARITVTAAATKNYNAASRQVTVSVLPGASSKLTAAAAANGKGIKLTWAKVAGATQYQVYRNNKLIKTVGNVATYTDAGANTNGAKYTFKIVAKASTGVSTRNKTAVYYKVNRPAVKKLTNSASKKMTVKWARNSKATGYEIQYGLKTNFKGAKTAKVTKNATVSKTIAKLTKGKTYYVRIRTYKKVGKVTYYSAWSTTKSIKIKK